MNGVLEFPSVKPQERDTEVLKQFAAQCVHENKASVIQMIKAINKPEYIIETITYKIMSLILAAKSKEDILKYISSGTYYKLTQFILKVFYDDPDISSLMQKQA